MRTEADSGTLWVTQFTGLCPSRFRRDSRGADADHDFAGAGIGSEAVEAGKRGGDSLPLRRIVDDGDDRIEAMCRPGLENATLLGNPVRIEAESGSAALDHTRGGGTLATSTGALACTTGFSARDDAGTVGAVTAGHCGNSYYYKAPDGSNYLMNVTASKYDQFNADTDFQWMVANHTTLGEFYADGSSTPRAVTGQRLQSSTSAGNYICHYGRYTGQSCGEVTSTAFAPTYNGGCNGSACNAVFVKVQGPDLKCWGGDSGGPWFAWNTAFGIHSGSSKSSPNAGDCNWAAYTSTGKVSYLGVSLIFS